MASGYSGYSCRFTDSLLEKKPQRAFWDCPIRAKSCMVTPTQATNVKRSHQSASRIRSEVLEGNPGSGMSLCSEGPKRPLGRSRSPCRPWPTPALAKGTTPTQLEAASLTCLRLLGSARSLEILCVEAHVPDRKRGTAWHWEGVASSLSSAAYRLPQTALELRSRTSQRTPQPPLSRAYRVSKELHSSRFPHFGDDMEEWEMVKVTVLVCTWRFEQHVVLT